MIIWRFVVGGKRFTDDVQSRIIVYNGEVGQAGQPEDEDDKGEVKAVDAAHIHQRLAEDVKVSRQTLERLQKFLEKDESGEEEVDPEAEWVIGPEDEERMKERNEWDQTSKSEQSIEEGPSMWIPWKKEVFK